MDLHTSYLGLTLKNPLVASASPLSKKVERVKRLEDAGVGAVVMYSLFEEQILQESLALNAALDYGSESFAEALHYFPDLEHYNTGAEGYLEQVRQLKEAVKIPVIASLNGITRGGWVDYARLIQQAGADALELNLYVIPNDTHTPAEELEARYLNLIRDVKSQISIPLAVKLSSFFTSLPNFMVRAAESGAQGLVLFNRFYQPDLDIEQLEVVPTLKLSTSEDMRLPLRWVAMLYGRVSADLALTSGVHTVEDVIRALMAGASVAMMASELIAKGPERTSQLLAELETWLSDHEYESVHQLQGSMSQKAVPNPEAFERANYMAALNTFDYALPYERA